MILHLDKQQSFLTTVLWNIFCFLCTSVADKDHVCAEFYLTDGNVVSRLLKPRRIVVAVSNDDADFV